MAFTFVLLLSALAAYAQAVPRYASGGLSRGVSPVLGLGRHSVGTGLVAPIHDLHDLTHGHGRPSSFLNRNRYDASKLIHDTVYNPRRIGGTGLGVVGGIGSHDPLSHGHGVHGGDLTHHIPHSHVCKCGLGEVCREDHQGRSFCQHVSTVNTGLGRTGLLGVGGRIGSRLNGVASQRCMYLEYPRSCIRTRGSNTITRYSFVNGRCQQIVASRVATWCRPEGESNNIFRTRFNCQRYCGL